jgi:hypothetical protein
MPAKRENALSTFRCPVKDDVTDRFGLLSAGSKSCNL